MSVNAAALLVSIAGLFWFIGPQTPFDASLSCQHSHAGKFGAVTGGPRASLYPYASLMTTITIS
jgi:hypothetical protein